MQPHIRKETPADYPAIHHLVREAFEHAEYSDHTEHHLVERLRASAAYIPELALVAEVDGVVAGYIMFTLLHVGDAPALGLAPVAVAPALQGKGIGGALIRAGHAIAKNMGYTFSILLGHAEYYPRFGYRPAATFGICTPFDWPEENFMACPLQQMPDRLEGMVKYSEAFML